MTAHASIPTQVKGNSYAQQASDRKVQYTCPLFNLQMTSAKRPGKQALLFGLYDQHAGCRAATLHIIANVLKVLLLIVHLNHNHGLHTYSSCELGSLLCYLPQQLFIMQVMSLCKFCS